MASYDASAVESFANTLYRRAAVITTIYTLAGFLLGILVSLSAFSSQATLARLLVTLTPTLLGYGLGRYRSFQLRLQAQMALCQRQIEANTH